MSMDQNPSLRARETIAAAEVAIQAATVIDDQQETIEDTRMDMMTDQDTRDMPARDTRVRA